MVARAVDDRGAEDGDRDGLLRREDDPLRVELRPSVVGHGAGAVVLERDAVERRAGGGEARDEDEAAKLRGVRLRGLDEVARPLHVRLAELLGGARLHEARGVDDRVHPLHRLGDLLGVLDPAVGKLDPVEPLEEIAVTALSHQRADVVPSARELLGDVASEEAARARDENLHEEFAPFCAGGSGVLARVGAGGN